MVKPGWQGSLIASQFANISLYGKKESYNNLKFINVAKKLSGCLQDIINKNYGHMY